MKYPDTLVVGTEKPEHSKEYLVMYRDIEEAAENKRKVAIYKLDRVVMLNTTIQVVETKNK